MSRDSDDAIEAGALERLTRIGGRSFVLEMIELFLENAPQRIEAARVALERGDYRTLYRSAHSLKSTAGNVGARVLQTTAERIEELASAQNGAPIAPLIETLDREWARVRERLEAERTRRIGS